MKVKKKKKKKNFFNNKNIYIFIKFLKKNFTKKKGKNNFIFKK